MPKSIARPAFSLALLLLMAAAAAQAAVPAGFTDSLVVDVDNPTALAFTPDGRMLITTQGGSLHIWTGALPLLTAFTFPGAGICSDFERGLLGIAVDPEFESNGFIYMFYTARVGTCAGNPQRNRVSRFTMVGNTVSGASELILVDNMRSQNGNHNAGDVQFGRDGYLYITIGDGGCDYASPVNCAGNNNAARDQHELIGKVLRITRDGGIPPSNPFQGAGTVRCNLTGNNPTAGNHCQETFAWGLRNPFRMAFDPNNAGTRFFINDVGQGLWEEVDLGLSGADYGWNTCEGAHLNNSSNACAMAGLTNPVYDYRHNLQIPGTTSSAGCNSITGGAFVPNGLWPGFDGRYLFSDYVCGWIVQLTPAFAASDFGTNLGGSSAVTLRFGPFGTTQALYYTDYDNGGEVRRISRDNPAGNDPPTAIAGGVPLSGPVPLNVTFDATGSTDPDPGETATLTYFWDFGDGTLEASTTNLTIQHVYNVAGTYTATLRARDTQFAFSSPVTLSIQAGNTPPVPSIQSPAADSTFAAGQLLTLTGSATDAEDASPLPDSALTWTVMLHHDAHEHPFFGPVTGNNVQFNAPNPEDLAAAANSYIGVILEATDSGSLTASIRRDIQPRKVNLTFTTQPPGLNVTLAGGSVTTPQTVISWESYGLQVLAPTQSSGGRTYNFVDWSDGGAATHTITTPAAAATYTARFSFDIGPVQFYSMVPCRALDTRNPNGPQGGPALAAGVPRLLDLTGICTIPAGAVAIAANITVVSATVGGNIQAYPGSEAGTSTSVLSVRAGLTRSGSAVLALDNSNALALRFLAPPGSTQAILDVVGYFAP